MGSQADARPVKPLTVPDTRPRPAPKPEGGATFDLVALLAVAGLLYLSWPVHAPLLDRDEPRYAAAARTMLETHDWVVPQFNGVPRYQKPVLIYWLMAGSMAAFGPSEWSARLPSALAALGTLALIHLTVRRRWGRRAAWIASAAFATAPLVVLWARAASTDSVLTLLLTCTILSGWRATECDGRVSRRWYVVSATCAGLAMLTKGPTAPLLFAVTLAIYLARRRRLLSETRRVPWGTVLTVFLAIGVPWYVAAYLRDGVGFFEVFDEEHVGRLIEGAGGPTGLRIWGRLVVVGAMLVGLAPWTPLSLAGALRRPAGGRGQPLHELAQAWFWCVLVAFSASKGQWPSYALPLAPAAAILAAGWIERVLRSREREGVAAAVVAGTVLLGLCLATVLAVTPSVSRYAPANYRDALSGSPMSQLLLASAAGVLAALALFVALWAGRVRVASVVAMSVAWGATISLFGLVCVPSVIRELSGPQVVLGRYLAAHATVPALTYGPREPTIVYYADRSVALLNKDDPSFVSMLERALSDKGQALVVTDREGASALAATYPAAVEHDAGRLLVCRLGAGAHGSRR